LIDAILSWYMDDLKFLRQSYYFLDDLGALQFKLFWKYVFSLATD